MKTPPPIPASPSFGQLLEDQKKKNSNLKEHAEKDSETLQKDLADLLDEVTNIEMQYNRVNRINK